MIRLDGVWEFQHDPARDLTPAGLGPMRQIRVPAPWQAQFDDLHLASGVGWYRRQFEVPSDWRGGTVLLRFGAVDYFAEVWLNGQRLGDHEGGYLPFSFEIQDQVSYDHPNELVVRVIDPGLDTAETFPAYRFAEIPHGKQSWYGSIGGIWQSVILERRGASYLRDLRLTPVPEPATEDHAAPDPPTGKIWRVGVECTVAHPIAGHLAIHILAPGGAVVAETALAISVDREIYQTSVQVVSPELWGLERPVLYRCEVELRPHLRPRAASPRDPLSPAVARGESGGRFPPASRSGHPSPSQWRGAGGEAAPRETDPPIDHLADTFGFRTIEARAGQILLNGRPIYLRGALDQAYYPGTIYTPPSEEFLRDRFQKAKDLGLNCLRCHIKIADPLYYRLADEMGLLVWTELPNWGGRRAPGTRHRTPLATARAEQTLEAMIRRDGNHPSIICWTIVNENWGTQVGDEPSDRAWLREMYDRVKALDPHRLVVDNSACRSNFHVKSDLDDFHFYYAIPDHAARWAATVADFAGRPAWSYSPHGDAQRTGAEPLLVSEFGNWGLPNVHDLVAGHGGEPWWFDTGTERGVVVPRGVLERFAALGLDRVFGSYDAFIAASQQQEYEALKYEIEEMRRHSSIQGYVITELTDVHWECNGLLDLCNNPKSFHPRFAAINADDVIVPRIAPTDRRAFWNDEAVSLELYMSRFSRREINGAMVRWWEGPRDQEASGVPVIGPGSMPRSADPPGAAGHLPLLLGEGGGEGVLGHYISVKDALTLTLSQREREKNATAPACMSLNFELVAASGTVARNALDLFVFPTALRRAPVVRALHLAGSAERVAELAPRLAEMGYRLVADWREADLVVGLGFDAALRAMVRDGARALCLVDAASTVSAELGPFRVVERQGSGYEGDWASSFSWLHDTRLHHRIPSGPRLDWPFASIIPDQVIVGLDAAAIARDGLAGLFLGWIHRPAALALQARLGRGKLLLTTLRLANPKGNALGADPVATVLFQDFVEHACSERFAPTLGVG